MLNELEGNTWVMNSVTGANNSENTPKTLPIINSRLTLPRDWIFRTKVLDQDFIL